MRSGSPQLFQNGGSVSKPPSFPFIIGVAGGSSSGKSLVCEKIVDALGQSRKSNKERQVYIINQDSFYRTLTPDEMERAQKFKFNFDHPDAVDLNAMKEMLRNIKDNRPITLSQYDYTTHTLSQSATTVIHNADVIIVEGILVFYDSELRSMLDIKLFVDTDSDTRLARRVLRDTEERHRGLDSVLQQYTRFTKPAFEEFCLPTKKYADVIIPRGNDNTVAISLIVQHIQDLLQCTSSRRSSLRGDGDSNSPSQNGVHSNGITQTTPPRSTSLSKPAPLLSPAVTGGGTAVPTCVSVGAATSAH
jgi:uridine kinase